MTLARSVSTSECNPPAPMNLHPVYLSVPSVEEYQSGEVFLTLDTPSGLRGLGFLKAGFTGKD